jgi:hypothetical protein
MANIINAITTGAGGLSTTADASGSIQIATNNGTTAMTIDTSQKVLVNTSTARANFQNSPTSPQLQLEGTDAATSIISSTRNSADTGGPRLMFGKSRGATIGSNTIVQNGDNVGQIAFEGNDGAEFVDAASISAIIDGTPGANDMPGALLFNTTADGAASPTERMRIDSSGNLLVGTTSATCNKIVKIRSQGQEILIVQNGTAYTADFFEVSSEGFNGAAAAIWVGKNSSTNRSINAGGTVNASGADYAEYMTKASNFTLAKGDVVGIDANGKLTNVFADAVSFCVKSTDPSYVGGDTWGNEEAIGKKPEDEDLLSEWETKLETARQLVDRIAFAGQVPVNVLGATAGQYIIPVNDNGSIKGQAISNPTFEQYQIAVGKVIAIEADRRAKIIVKVA